MSDGIVEVSGKVIASAFLDGMAGAAALLSIIAIAVIVIAVLLWLGTGAMR